MSPPTKKSSITFVPQNQIAKPNISNQIGIKNFIRIALNIPVNIGLGCATGDALKIQTRFGLSEKIALVSGVMPTKAHK